jgi:hypothetical protein
MTGKRWNDPTVRGSIPDTIPPNGVSVDVWDGSEQAWKQVKLVGRKDGERGTVLMTQDDAREVDNG